MGVAKVVLCIIFFEERLFCIKTLYWKPAKISTRLWPHFLMRMQPKPFWKKAIRYLNTNQMLTNEML